MAAPCFRLACHVFKRKHIPLNQNLIILNSERDYRTKSNNSHRTRSGSTNNDSNHFVTSSAIFASTLGYVLYKWKELREDIDFVSPFPSVHAATNIHATNVSHNREKYNFIADVVEVSAPSVVYIEIKDQRR